MIFGINQHDENQFNPLCLTLGIFLHWSLLVTFMWSLLAGFQVYLLLVVIFESDTTSRMSKYKNIIDTILFRQITTSIKVRVAFFLGALDPFINRFY